MQFDRTAHWNKAYADKGEAGVSWFQPSPDFSVGLIESIAGGYDVWHDRAVFHFLTDAGDRAAYADRLRAALKSGGHAVIATFAPDGPERCSGLPVQRYDAPSLHAAIGDGFRLAAANREVHATPWGSTQSFQFSMFERT